MRSNIVTKLAVVILAFSSVILAQDSDPSTPAPLLNATSIKYKVYKIALSTSAECTNPVTLIESAAGVQSDLLSTPTLAKGKIASGTYRCIMVELSKIVNTTSTGTCTTAQNNLICADGQDSKLINGTAVSCSGGTGNDQRVVLYYNTLSASTSGNRVLLPPTSAADTTSGVTLGTPVVFPTNKRAAVRINKQVIQDGTCNISNPTFSISIQ